MTPKKISGRLRRLTGNCRHFAVRTLGRSMGGLVGRRSLTRNDTCELLDVMAAQRSENGHFLLEAGTGHRKIDILQSGVVRVGGKDCLDLDYGSRAALLGWRGATREVGQAAVVWSHFWFGYYHWIIDVLPKLCDLKQTLRKDFAKVRICYPFWNQAFESETLDLLEIPKNQCLDSRRYRSIRVISQLHGHVLPGWYRIPDNARLAREMLIDRGMPSSHERIYVARKGRRRCLNETEVRAALEHRGFVFIADQPRSLIEQIGLFRNARFVVAPHGAALANLLWCEPGARVLEIFGSGYQPDFYRNLSDFNQLEYDRLTPTDRNQGHWTAMADDYLVDLPSLRDKLDLIDN